MRGVEGELIGERRRVVGVEVAEQDHLLVGGCWAVSPAGSPVSVTLLRAEL
jgi:hypothetical protein